MGFCFDFDIFSLLHKDDKIHFPMIKFFRKTRYNLMSENKKGKYFKYAVGEILLVVIGILIALQINNWNENRKVKNNEIVLLTKLQEENTLLSLIHI